MRAHPRSENRSSADAGQCKHPPVNVVDPVSNACSQRLIPNQARKGNQQPGPVRPARIIPAIISGQYAARLPLGLPDSTLIRVRYGTAAEPSKTQAGNEQGDAGEQGEYFPCCSAL